MFGPVEDYGEIFQDSVVQTKDASLSSANQVENPVVYKLVRVAGDGSLVPATDEEILEVKDFLENNSVPDPGQMEGYIPGEGSPSQLLQLESLQGLFQSETAEAYAENLDSRHEAKEELMYGSQMLFSLPDTKFQISNELCENEEHIQSESFLQDPINFLSNGWKQSIDGSQYSNATDSRNERALSTPASKLDFSGVRGEMFESQMLFTLPDAKFQISDELSGNEEHIQSKVSPQEPIHFSSNGCIMSQSIDASPYSNATDSPKEPALSTPASKPELSRERGQMPLNNLSIKALQEIFRGTFGRETTVKDKPWLKKRIAMGLVNSCVVPTCNLIEDNKLVTGGQDNCNDTIDCYGMDMVVERRTSNCKDTLSSPEDLNGHSNDFLYSSKTIGDHYSGSEEFGGEHRPAKRVRKLTERYIEEISKTDEKQLNDESMIPLEDQRCIGANSAGGKVVVTRMLSLAGSTIEVPYVCHVRRSRPRENITALGEFHPSSWEGEAMPEESNLNLSPTQLNSDLNRVSGIKPASGPIQKESNKDDSKPILTEVDQDSAEGEHLDTYGDSSDDSGNHVNLPIMQNAVRRKHHRAWSLSEVIKLVEGVSKLGVGKWSEIKRLSSSSFPHRTPVDIKDKWRNLLKASFTSPKPNKMGSLRKHGSMTVPDHILLKVKELAQKQSMVSPASRGARMVKGSRKGFL